MAAKSAEEEQRIFKGLRSNRLLRLLDEDQRKALANLAYKKSFTKGSVIIEQGALDATFYIVDNGECDVFYNPGNGETIVAVASFLFRNDDEGVQSQGRRELWRARHHLPHQEAPPPSPRTCSFP